MCCSVGNIQKRVTSSVAQAAPWYQQAEHHVASQLHTSLQFPGDNTATRKSCLHLPLFPPLFPEVTREMFAGFKDLFLPTEAVPCFTPGVCGGGGCFVSLFLHCSQPSAASVVWVLGCASVFFQEGPALSFLYFLFIGSQLIFQSECTFTLIFFLWVPCLSI